MKPLIDKDSPLYLRRMVRELNAEAMKGDGFIAPFLSGDARCQVARQAPGGDWIECRTAQGQWAAPLWPGYAFRSVSSGEEITASRAPK